MFNKPLFIQTAKSNFQLWAIITGVLCLLITVIMGVFDPNTMDSIRESSVDLPFNPLGDISTLIAFISNQYYGMMAIIFPMIYVIITGNKLIAGQVDRGNMAYNLSAPLTRGQVTGTSAVYLVSSLGLMFSIIGGVGVAVAEIMQSGELDISVFLTLTLGCFLLMFAISAISFFASCLFNSTGQSLALGAGLPLAFFAFNFVGGMSDKLEFLQSISLNSLFDTSAIIDGEGFVLKLITLLVIGIVLYILGGIIFNRRDLPL